MTDPHGPSPTVHVFITGFNCKLGLMLSEEPESQLAGRSCLLPVDRRDSALFGKLADSPTSPLACTSSPWHPCIEWCTHRPSSRCDTARLASSPPQPFRMFPPTPSPLAALASAER